MRTEDIGTEVFFFPAAAHTEKSGSFTNTNRMLQWHHEAVEPEGDARSDLWFIYHLGRRIRERLASSTDPMDRAVLGPDLGLPDRGAARRARRRGGAGGDQRIRRRRRAAVLLHRAEGRRLDLVRLLDLLRGLRRRRQPGRPPQAAHRAGLGGRRVGLGLARQPAHPLQPRLGGPRRQPVERPQGAGVVGRGSRAGGPGTTSPTSSRTGPRPRTVREPAPTGPDALSGDDPFIMQADGKGWLYAPAGLVDGPLPTHYEPQDSPVRQPAPPAPAAQPGPAGLPRARTTATTRAATSPGSDVYPYVVTTYRLTEHFTAGGMTRWSPYLAELQPEFFCEVSPELAAGTRAGARWLGHDRHRARRRRGPRAGHRPDVAADRAGGRTVHQIGLPYHWGPNGYATGDAANELTSPSRSTRTCTSRRSRHSPPTSGPDAAPGARPAAARLAEYRQRGRHHGAHRNAR